MPKFGLVLPYHNDHKFLAGLLELTDCKDNIIIFSDIDFQGNRYKRDWDSIFPFRDRLTILPAHTSDQGAMRNLGIAYAQTQGLDYVFLLDADEWPSYKALETIKKACEQGHPAYAYKMISLFKEPTIAAEAPTDTGTLVAVRTDQRITGKRNFNNDVKIGTDGDIFHFSWVGPIERIKKKLIRSSHAKEILPEWFENVYQKFTLETRNFHPTHPAVFPTAYRIKLPEEIEKAYIKYIGGIHG